MIKINSKFSDYYDSAIGAFPDSEVVFNRNPKIETYHFQDFPSLGESFDGNVMSKEAYIADCDKEHEFDTFDPRLSDLTSFWLGLAGKWYAFTTTSDLIGTIVWSRHSKADLENPPERFKALFDPSVIMHAKQIDFEDLKKYSLFDYYYARTCGIRGPINVNREFRNPSETEFWKDEAFDKFGPVFLAVFPVQSKYANNSDKKRIWIFKNPCLKTIRFQRIMDPFTALWNRELDRQSCKTR